MQNTLNLVTKEFLEQYVDKINELRINDVINVELTKGTSKMFLVVGYKPLTTNPVKKSDLSDCDLSKIYIHLMDSKDCMLLTSNLERQIGDFRFFDSDKILEFIGLLLTKFESLKRYILYINNEIYLSTDTIEKCKNLYNQLLLEYLNVNYINSAYIRDSEAEFEFFSKTYLIDKKIKSFKAVI